MKFLHIADVHLGAAPDANKPWGEGRNQEIWDTFEKVIRYAGNQHIELVLISGDLFHRQPLLRELKEVDYLFKSISPVQIVLIAGNHDCIRESSYYNTYKWADNVHFIWDNKMTHLRLHCSNVNKNVDVYGFSYHNQEDTRRMYDQIDIIDTDAINILIGHGGDESHCPYNVSTIGSMGFDYVAFGHIHKPGVNREMAMANVGSLEPLNVNETGAHGYVAGEIDENSKRCIMRFFAAAKRRYYNITIESKPDMTTVALREYIEGIIKEYGRTNIYSIVISGVRNGDMVYDKHYLETLGNIMIDDKTVPDYNFEEIYEANKDNLLGHFVRQMQSKEQNETTKKALYYGTKALLEAMEVED